MVTRRSKRLTIEDDEDNFSNNFSEKSPKASGNVTIPKKAKTQDEQDRDNNDAPSLLSGMKKPQIPKANVSKSTGGGVKGSSGSAKSAPSRTPSASLTSTTIPAPVGVNDGPGPQSDAAAPGTKAQENSSNEFGLKMRQLVFDGLKELCKDAFQNPPERDGADLFASFLRHKDLNPTTQTSGINADGSNSLQYDFFDFDETTGSIVLQPKIPIFPEDFPPGSKEWPLSWWGIAEPSIEEKRSEEKIAPRNNDDKDVKNHSRSRRDRKGATSESGREGNEDQYRRENSRTTRKRSSRDRYEDEYGYDRFPAKKYDDRDGYPPHHRGRDFDYDNDRNGRSPNRYPNSRYPHDRGGREPLPPRMRDGPLSRNFDGPPPGNFRGEGRPYPPHGGGGPPPLRDYQHRDPYGPPGRGPPPPRDDRREHRDRSHWSPHSISERDDGRHSGRNPPHNGSSRKDRPHSSR